MDLISVLIMTGLEHVTYSEPCAETHWREQLIGFIPEHPDYYLHVERVFYYHVRVTLASAHTGCDVRVWCCPQRDLSFTLAQAQTLAIVGCVGCDREEAS